MIHRFRVVALLACLAALATASGAAAVVCAPPGTSGVDQYFETIPGASCNAAPPGTGVAGSGGSHAGHLTPARSRQLAAQGPAGRAVAGLVSATAPPIAARSSSGPGGRGAGAGGRAASSASATGNQPVPLTASGQSPIAGVLKPIVSGSAPGGSGTLLPIFLLGVLLIGIVAALVSRRFRS